MAAGTQYAKKLNMDQNYVKTPAIYDSNLDEWLMLAGNYVKTAGGLWVPQKAADDGTILAQLTGSSVPITAPVYAQKANKVEVSTVLSAVSVPAGGETGFTTVDVVDGTESLILFLFNIDQQPWTVYAKNIVNGSAPYHLYPEINNCTVSPTNPSLPYSAIWIPYRYGNADKPSSYQEALAMAGPTVADYAAINVRNNSSSTATLNVKVARIWR